jgi:hypothetical protein
MSRRWMVAGLAIVAVIAVAVPALAGEFSAKPSSVQFLNLKRVQLKARKLSKRALRIANLALANSGKPGATGAPGAPATSPSAPFFGQAAGPDATSSVASYVSLPGRPSVTVNVPQAAHGPPGTGFIEVAAQAHIDDDAGAVALFQDGSAMPGQSDVCDAIAGTPSPPLFASTDGLAGTWSTPASIIFSGNCANTGPAAPVMFSTSPGSHIYELRYNFCGCAGSDATFSARKLWVTPLN